MDIQLQRSYAAAREVMRHHAHTFYFAALWLRPDRRRATHALYSLFRTLDDLVDEVAEGERDPGAAREELQRWRAWLNDPEANPRVEPILPAVRDTLTRYAIPSHHFIELIDGLEMDLAGRRYADVADLGVYCYRVASTVGLAMCHVLGAVDPAAQARAVELGVAMQLTNILRDVREDFENGRIYVPHDLMARAGWDEDRLRDGRVDDAFRAMMGELVSLARVYYDRGMRGLPYLSPDARLAIRVAARCYAAILDRIEAADYDVFSARAHVSGRGKAGIAARAALDRRAAGRGALPPLPDGAPDGTRLIALARAPRDRHTPTSPATPSPRQEPEIAIERPARPVPASAAPM